MTTTRQQEQAMLCAALARLREACQVMDDLLTNDAPADALIGQLCELSYVAGQIQGAGALFIPRHGRPSAP